MAKKPTAKKATAKKPSAKKPPVKKAAAKKAAAKKPTTTAPARGGRLLTAAERIGRTLGRAASGVDTVKAVAKKAVAGKRGAKKPKRDPVAEAERAQTRAAWKSQSKAATSVELSKHGSLVDERARVRATTGMSWSNRKPR